MPIYINADDTHAIAQAADVIHNKGLVIFPTETFYGLAVDPHQPEAVQRLADSKARDPHKPIPLIASSAHVVQHYIGNIPSLLQPLCAAFWPGPLTIVLTVVVDDWPQALLGTGDSLGVRVSSHPIAQQLAAAAGGLITSTSANLRDGQPVCSVADLHPDLVAQVDLVLDAGLLPGGAPSTIVAEQQDAWHVIRQGAIRNIQLDIISRSIRDTFWHGALTVWQPKRAMGYRFNIDSVLLANFANVHGHVLDLGAGCGILGILLLVAKRCEYVTAVERQEHLAALMQHNITANHLKNHMHVVHGDLRDTALPQVDHVVFNPPYFANNTGPISTNQGRAAGRFEQYGTLQDFIACAAAHLAPHGTISCISRSNRQVELQTILHKHGLHIQRLRNVQSRAHLPPEHIMLQASLHASQADGIEEAPLVVYQHATGQDFSEEVKHYFSAPASLL